MQRMRQNAAVGLIDDYWFYPSVSCSEHLFKKSMLTYKALPAANSGESWANIPITILQVSLRGRAGQGDSRS